MDDRILYPFICDGSSTEVYPYRAVQFGATAGEVDPPSAAKANCCGVIQEGSDRAGKHVDVCIKGKTHVEANSAISIGDRLRAAATTGRVEKAAASYTTVLSGANNDLVWTAIGQFQGVLGNSISIAYVDPSGASHALPVTVTGNAISVSLATDTSSAITSTAAQVEAAVEAHAVAGLMVSAANSVSDSGAGVVTALSATHLSGGEGDFGTALSAATAQTEIITMEVD